MAEMTMFPRERDRRDHDHQPLETSLHNSLSSLTNAGVDIRDGRSLPMEGRVWGSVGGIEHRWEHVRRQGLRLQSRDILRRERLVQRLVVCVRRGEGVGGAREVE